MFFYFGETPLDIFAHSHFAPWTIHRLFIDVWQLLSLVVGMDNILYINQQYESESCFSGQ